MTNSVGRLRAIVFSRTLTVKRACMLVVGLAAASLSGCVSAERQAALDKDECSAQGFTPASSEFTNCITSAGLRHEDARARQSLTMRQRHDQEVDDFLTSSRMAP
jgi:hypothetical protein